MINKQVINTLKKEQETLKRIIQDSERIISRAPEGSVQIKRHKKGFQFYYRSGPADKNGTYIPVSKRKTALSLVQKRYHSRVLCAAQKQYKAISTFLRNYDEDALKDVFIKEGEARQSILKSVLSPVMLPDDQYSALWQAQKYEGKPFSDDIPVHYTHKHERVRSKSEVIIANALYNAKIPYHYEYPLKMGTHIIYPDFTVLRTTDRRVLYWEHLGLIDETEYRNSAVKRIREYEESGIFPGDKLIITCESFKIPLNAQIVERMIRKYLM